MVLVKFCGEVIVLVGESTDVKGGEGGMCAVLSEKDLQKEKSSELYDIFDI